MPDLEDALKEFNPWWKRRYQLEYKPREIYQEIKEFMSDPQIIALTGLRRTGKTTLIHKIIHDAMEESNIDPANIIYFSFDEFKETEIRKILRKYREIFDKDIRKGKILLVLDETQKLSNWENQIKTIYDNYKDKIKIVVSGSESLFIRKGARETLAGRVYEFKLKPLTFREYLVFKGVREKLKPLRLYRRELKKLFKEYVKTLGFPELVGITNKKKIRKYIDESIIEKVVYRDLVKLTRVRDIEKIESLLRIIMERPGQVMKIQDLAKDLNLSRTVLSNYMTYLEKSFLIKKLYNYSNNRRKTERKLKKIYPVVLSTTFLFKGRESQIFECFLANQLETEFFWRDPYKNEVDFILIPERKIVPVEAKYGKVETKGLEKFMDKYGVKEGWVLTEDEEKEIEKGEKKIHVVPAYKYLLEFN